MLLEIHFEEEGEYESIESISVSGEFGHGDEEIVLNGERSSAEFLGWDSGTRTLSYFLFLDNDYEFETGSTYTLTFLATNGTEQPYDFVIEDAQRDYPNITEPEAEEQFAAPQDIVVRWTHPIASTYRDGKVIESYHFLLERETDSNFEWVWYRNLFPATSNNYEVTIPATALTDDSKYRVHVEYRAHYTENTEYFKKVRTWMDFTVGDYQDSLQLNEADPEAGYHFPFFTYFNETANTNWPVYIMVLPLITGEPSEDFNFFLRSAEQTIRSGYDRF